MKGRLLPFCVAAILGVFAFPRCSACWDDPDDPKVWVKKLKEANTKFQREEALVNLYRIYEVNKAMSTRAGKDGDKYKKKVAAFKKMVNPALVEVFRKKIKNKYLVPNQLIEKMVIFEANDSKVSELFIEIITKYSNGDADEYGDEDTQEALAAKAVDGLGQIAARDSVPSGALKAIGDMISQVCRKRGTGKGAEGLDPRSFVRNAVVKSIPNFLKAKGTRSTLAKILGDIVRFGNTPKSGQDPMVTIFGIRLLGDVGDISERVVKSLVLSLLGKGRGRRFFSFAATAIAKLPNDASGKHPALQPLLYMLKGDPWKRKIDDYNAKIKAEELSKKKSEKKIKAWKEEIAPLEKRYKLKKVAPKCPYASKYQYICDLIWQAHIEDWESTEPGVIPMNALMVLRELGEKDAIPVMLQTYGWKSVRKRWLAHTKTLHGAEEFKDKDLPGVQMQKMQISMYGKDMNVRSVMLRALGRMGATKVNPQAKKEILKSLYWSGDPTMLVKAGEGAYLAPYDEDLMNALIKWSRKAASYMMTNFKKRQIKMFFWGKILKGTCPEAETLDKKFKDCLRDPPKIKIDGKMQKEVKDANWNCFEKFKEHWLKEFRYAVGYHKSGEFKKLVHPFCQKTDDWWNNQRKALMEKAKSSDGYTAQKAKNKLYACLDNPPAKALKEGEIHKCQEYSICSGKNSFLCLDGHWQLRINFHRHASLLATDKHAEVLMAFKASDIMGPHGLRKKNLPVKDKSAFFDADDKMYLNYTPWSKVVEKARLKKAAEVIEQRLCEHRKYLRVAKRCGSNVGCYVRVVEGASDMQLETEDCSKIKSSADRGKVKRMPPEFRAKVKALRMMAHYGHIKGPNSQAAKDAIKGAVAYYEKAQRLARKHLFDMRDMVLLVIDRAGDFKAQKNVMCPYPYAERRKEQLKEKYNIPRYEEKMARAKKMKRTEDAKKYKKKIKDYMKKVDKELVKITKKQPCFKILKLIVEDETERRVKGVWQINRNARNTLGRLARRAGLRYDQI